MSIFSTIGGFFSGAGHAVAHGVKAAVSNGLTQEVVTLATGYVRSAAESTVSNDQKREIVVKLLTARGVPEGIARIAVELAYQVVKYELNKPAA